MTLSTRARIFRAHPRGSMVACRVCEIVWRHLERLPGFSEGLREAERDIAAGRVYRWEPDA